MTILLGRLEAVRRPPWRSAVAALVASLALGVVAAAGEVTSPADLDPLLRSLSIRPWWGDPPPLEVQALDGQRYSLARLRGRVALLYFWATWCPICTAELPSQIESVHREFKDQGLVVWAISFREPPERVQAWLRQHSISSQVLLDVDGRAAEAYRTTGTPTFVLIDRTGQLAGRGVGPRDWSGERGRALIRVLLAPP
jgi:peroxiredoxin